MFNLVHCTLIVSYKEGFIRNNCCQVRWVKNSPAKRALWNFSRPYLTKFFVQGFQATLGPLASLCMLATLATQTPMLCFGFASAALMFFALTSLGRKTGHPASSVCQALEKYYFRMERLSSNAEKKQEAIQVLRNQYFDVF